MTTEKSLPRAAGYISTCDGLAIVSDRPAIILPADDQITFHAEKQPADFWDWTGAQVIACDNLELRSIVIECVG